MTKTKLSARLNFYLYLSVPRSRKFSQSFDSFKIRPDILPSVITTLAEAKSMKDLAENPLYYLNAFQYLGGDFYRAFLGYETLWDKSYEERLIKILDYYLDDLINRKLYYFETIQFRTGFRCLTAQKWARPDATPPKTFVFNGFCQFQRGEVCLARVNRLEPTPRVDLERQDGRVVSLTWKHYEFLSNNGIVKPKEDKGGLALGGSHIKIKKDLGPKDETADGEEPTHLPHVVSIARWKEQNSQLSRKLSGL